MVYFCTICFSFSLVCDFFVIEECSLEMAISYLVFVFPLFVLLDEVYLALGYVKFMRLRSQDNPYVSEALRVYYDKIIFYTMIVCFECWPTKH